MFKIIGADQKEYGPVATAQIRQWITDGRLNAATMAQRATGGEWQPLSVFEEFADLLQSAGATPAPQAATATPFTPAAAALPTASREMALAAVKGPAIALIVVASLGIAYFLFSVIFGLVMGEPPRSIPSNTTPFARGLTEGMHGPLASLVSLFCAALNGFILFGALRMLKLRGHSLAIITCIVAMLPCVTVCCILGLPFGIWGVVMLNKPEVKSQFTN
jgi:hypothetical protein